VPADQQLGNIDVTQTNELMERPDVTRLPNWVDIDCHTRAEFLMRCGHLAWFGDFLGDVSAANIGALLGSGCWRDDVLAANMTAANVKDWGRSVRRP
jgi:hypothetical protein